MYHEILMALLGHTGDVFQYDGSFMKVSKDLQVPLFHPSELIIVEQILEVAAHYKRLETFLDSQFKLEFESALMVSGASMNGTTNKKRMLVGLYISALCNGIRDICEQYQKEIADLEMQILENPYMTVTGIRAKVEPFRAVFETLDAMLMKVQAESRSSTLIVEIVKTEFDLSVHVQESLRRLIPWVNKILYNQIINWIVFGVLQDPKGEFFVKQCNPELMDSSGVSQLTQVEVSSSSSKSTLSNKPSSHKGSSNNQKKNPEKYYVDYAVVPSHFPVPLTERILYIGTSIGTLSNSEKTRNSIVLKQKQFYDKLKDLPTETFRIEELSQVIGEIAVDVGRDLHHLIVAETDLPKHLGIVKDFYLTGRGELFHDFLLNLQTIPMVKSSLLSDIRRAFTLAATRVHLQDDILQRIQIHVAGDLSKPTLSQLMNSISLEMEDEWPLHILFTPESLLRYNELFRFLLQIRMLQMELNRIWIDTRRVFRFPIPQGPAELRNVMSFFIDHLQHYLQEDVLENQYAILTAAVEKSENFDQIFKAHTRFQTNILSQSFRSSRQLSHFLDEILKVCNNYVTFMSKHIRSCEQNDVPFNEGISDDVVCYFKDFRRHMDLLLNLLKSIAVNPKNGQFLGQFLLRLDFNSYFSSKISSFNV